MAKINISINGKEIDVLKASPELSHEFVPDLDWNEDGSCKVTCRYFRTGENSRYLVAKADGSGATVDWRRIFELQVDSITGLVVNGVELTKAEQVLNLPSNVYTDALVLSVGSHIMAGVRLTEDERKN